jgi:hypothetical protein
MAQDIYSNMPPEIALQQQGLTRQQEMAKMLLAQGAQQNAGPSGQMVSGHYVPNSFFQNLQGPVNQMLGAYLGKQADTKATELAQKLRAQEMSDLQNYQTMTSGRPQLPSEELAGPAYNGVVPKIDYPAIQANPQAANLFAASSYSPALRAMGMKKLTEGPKWNEVSKYNEKTGNTETYVYDQNSSNPESTMRYVSTSKPALTPHEVLTLNDSGIGTGRFGGAPTAGGTVAPVVGGGQANATIKPVSATNAPENALVNTYGYDPFKAPPMPAMPSGSAARSWKADIYKPLEGTPANTVTGATTYVDALGKYHDYVNGLSAKDLANPQVRTKLTSLYAQVKLTGKEANNLGVLNGGDERILEEVVPNYSNILVTKNTVKKILDEQKEFGSSKIVATYRTAQKPVPENMRKYVVVPKVEEPTTGTPKQTGATAKAVLNGRQIEVKNGKWVDSQTGQEVK